MEESPHKCPVCSRSFNQRSNLKTHLLTHTDHKPYECNSCGKVFRRNCDLRRHALTHAVGDVPGSDPLDPIDESMGIASDNEDDTVLEVDSPVHSPITSVRSPSPNGMPVSAELQDTEEDVEERDIVETDVAPATSLMSRYDRERFEVTHCHHERPNGSHSPYTMRPQNYYERDYKVSPLTQSSLTAHQFLSQSQDTLLQPSISSGSSRSDVFLPMLHVRRDLHQKNIGGRAPATVTSGISAGETQVPNFLSSIPLRKRPIGSDGEPSQHPIIVRNMMYGIHHRPHSLMKSPEEMTMVPMISVPTPELQHETPTRLPPSLGSPLLMAQQPPQVQVPLILPVPPSQASQQSQQSQKSVPPPLKRTGFSIEDIMRR